MARGFARAALVAALAIAFVWLLQAAGLANLIDDPLVGIVAFAALGAVFALLARKAEADAARHAQDRS